MRIAPISIKFSSAVNLQKSNFSKVFSSTECDKVQFTGKNQENHKTVVVLLGAPNSGKGTYAREITKKYGIPQISTGDILRNEVKNQTKLGLEAKSYMDSGDLVPDDVIMQIFEKRISQDDCKKGYILDGFPRTIDQAKKLETILDKENNLSLKIINLDVDESILYERCANRYMCDSCSKTHSLKDVKNVEDVKCDCGGNLIKRKDDTVEVLAVRLKNYSAQTRPLIDYYGDSVSFIEVHGQDRPVDDILLDVYSKIDE